LPGRIKITSGDRHDEYLLILAAGFGYSALLDPRVA
jgi:hypothetical protein